MHPNLADRASGELILEPASDVIADLVYEACKELVCVFLLIRQKKLRGENGACMGQVWVCVCA
jgi:hypothetical protein